MQFPACSFIGVLGISVGSKFSHHNIKVCFYGKKIQRLAMYYSTNKIKLRNKIILLHFGHVILPMSRQDTGIAVSAVLRSQNKLKCFTLPSLIVSHANYDANKLLIHLTSIPTTTSIQTWQVLSTVSSYSAIISIYIYFIHGANSSVK